jgi:hypothetical protein
MVTKGTLLMLVCFSIVWLSSAQPAVGQEQTIVLTVNDVTSHASEDVAYGAYYTLAFDLPTVPEGARLEHAVLEFYVDVAAKTRDQYVNDTPILEVYAFTSTFDGDLNPAEWDTNSTVTQPLLWGEEKHVVMDVTAIIRSFLDNPNRNHGLVIGSLTGMREGDFSVRTGRIPGGGVMRIHVYFEPDLSPRGRE